MSLTCPYGDYVTPTETPNEEAAALLEHLGIDHHPEQKMLFVELAEGLRDLLFPNK